jgi:hypothetical protein
MALNSPKALQSKLPDRSPGVLRRHADAGAASSDATMVPHRDHGLRDRHTEE